MKGLRETDGERREQRPGYSDPPLPQSLHPTQSLRPKRAKATRRGHRDSGGVILVQHLLGARNWPEQFTCVNPQILGAIPWLASLYR